MKNKIFPPIANKIPKKLRLHGFTRIDNYYWMNKRDDTEVLKYLNEENTYFSNMMKHTERLQQKLYKEMVSRIKKDDSSVPYEFNSYYYYTRTEGKSEYPLYCRKKNTLKAKEEILLNVSQMAKKYAYYYIGDVEVSPNNKLLAYSVDNKSRGKYKIYFKNIETQKVYNEIIHNTSGDIVWANDNKTIFYIKKHIHTLLPYKVFKHEIGTDISKDKLVYEEKDNRFYTFCYKTKSQKYIVIGSESTLTDEYRFIKADNPNDCFKIFQHRNRKIEYSIEHYEDSFYILTNWKAKNFCLMKTPVNNTEKKNWKMVIPPRDNVLLNTIEVFKDYLAVEETKDAQKRIRIINWKTQEEHYIKFKEEPYHIWTSVNMNFSSPFLRFCYTSLTTPKTTYNYNFKTRERIILKEEKVLGNFSKVNYLTKRLWTKSKDGTKLPISIVHHKNTKLNGTAPLLIKGYGAYGINNVVYFSSVWLSLLNRGFIIAIAHIRGGQEMGRYWYEQGKLLQKKNTFTDFIYCTRFFIEKHLIDKSKIFASGGSAGGLLMGAIANMQPKLYCAICANVPFVDVVTTMLDKKIPLTTGEFDEWGNPRENIYFNYMLDYSPYDNIKKQHYPAMLVKTGYYDSQVQFWEPAKWVAKLRYYKIDANPLLFKVDMKSGHSGISGRFKRLKEIAIEFAFILDLLNIRN